MTSSTLKIELHCIEFPKDGLTPTTSSWVSTRKKVVDALEKYGCFMAKYDTLQGFRSNLFNNPKQIFDPLAKTSPGKPDFTYKKNDNYESIDILEVTTKKGPDMSQAILNYTRTAAVLEKMVREMVLEHYQLPQESPGYLFQMMKYKKNVRFDFSDYKDKFLAVLDLNQADGLELEMKYDDKWSKISVRPSTFLIMAGKPLIQACSNRRIHPLGLRVKMDGNKEKYSVGLFSYRKGQVGSSSGS